MKRFQSKRVYQIHNDPTSAHVYLVPNWQKDGFWPERFTLVYNGLLAYFILFFLC